MDFFSSSYPVYMNELVEKNLTKNVSNHPVYMNELVEKNHTKNVSNHCLDK